MGFYSKAERAVRDKVKGPVSALQLRATLLGAGVSPDEMKWSGLDDLIDAEGPGLW